MQVRTHAERVHIKLEHRFIGSPVIEIQGVIEVNDDGWFKYYVETPAQDYFISCQKEILSGDRDFVSSHVNAVNHTTKQICC